MPASTGRSTHFAVAPSHCWPGHCASLVQPTRHVKVVGSQIGSAWPQSAFDVHASHVPVRMRQRGRAPEQVASLMHATHVFVAGAHTPDAQSVSTLQPTHAPDALSHAVPAGHATASPHAG
jgi:hypothetical protein